MKIVVFGLVVSSSWGNGHATLWRALGKALGRRGHRLVFFERDVPYYAEHRDTTDLPGVDLRLYGSFDEILDDATREVRDADAALVTSYCPDALSASGLVLAAPRALRVFYDMDTPVTLDRVGGGEPVEYLPPDGLGEFDLVLSYTGGQALIELKETLGAKRVAALYGSVDPEVHRPAEPSAAFAADLSYLGTYAPDRQPTLDALLCEPARRLPHKRFVVGGSQYPREAEWPSNVRLIAHVAPADHPAFFRSSPLTLNVTRKAMAAFGYCPSGRLFEAAACGAPVLSDDWEGLDQFFEPELEILIARTPAHAMDALARDREHLARIGRAARERALSMHTADHRVRELELILQAARQPESAGGAH